MGDRVRHTRGRHTLALGAAFAACAFVLGFKLGVRPVVGPLTGLLIALTTALGWAAWCAGRACDSERAARSPVTARKLALWTVLLLVGVVLAEATLLLTVRQFEARLRRLGFMRAGDGPALLGPETFASFLRTGFDAELGWDQPRTFPPFGRARPAPDEYSTALVSAYGESYTECKGPDEETWEAHLSRRLGTRVINYGVAGYGPDQALLKFRREARRYPTRVVLFGYLCENVARLVNVYRFAYDAWATGSVFDAHGRPLWSPTKPRFVLDHAGGLRLVPNPVRDASDLERLIHEPAFAARLAAGDHFADGYAVERTAPTLAFPYLFTLPRAVYRSLTRAPRPDVVRLLMDDALTRRLLFATIDAFVAEAEQRGSRPVVVLFGMQDDLAFYAREGRHLHLEALVEHLRTRGHGFVDTVALLAAQRARLSPPPPVDVYYDGSSHHSSYAHRVLAEVLEGPVAAALERAAVPSATDTHGAAPKAAMGP